MNSKISAAVWWEFVDLFLSSPEFSERGWSDDPFELFQTHRISR